MRRDCGVRCVPGSLGGAYCLPMDVRVLGPIEVFVDGADVTPTSPNQRAVLAALAAHPDQHVSTDTLVDALWGADPPPTAARTLRSYVSRLRSVMATSIVASHGGLCLRTKGIRLDSTEFERQVASAKLLAPAACVVALRSAIGLWRGGPSASWPTSRPFAPGPAHWSNSRSVRASSLRTRSCGPMNSSSPS